VHNEAMCLGLALQLNFASKSRYISQTLTTVSNDDRVDGEYCFIGFTWESCF